MAGLIFLSFFGIIASFMFLGTKMTLLHEKYFGKGSIDEMFYPFIFVMLGISIVIEIAVRF